MLDNAVKASASECTHALCPSPNTDVFHPATRCHPFVCPLCSPSKCRRWFSFHFLFCRVFFCFFFTFVCLFVCVCACSVVSGLFLLARLGSAALLIFSQSLTQRALAAEAEAELSGIKLARAFEELREDRAGCVGVPSCCAMIFRDCEVLFVTPSCVLTALQKTPRRKLGGSCFVAGY